MQVQEKVKRTPTIILILNTIVDDLKQRILMIHNCVINWISLVWQLLMAFLDPDIRRDGVRIKRYRRFASRHDRRIAPMVRLPHD